MPWSPQLTVLRNRLAVLFPKENDARLVVDEAQLDPAHIAFDSKAINNWHSILTQAELRSKVEAVVWAAISHYGEDAELVVAYTAYMSSIGKTAQPIPANQPTIVKTETSKYNITINNAQGLVIGDNAQVTQNLGTQVNTEGGSNIAGNVDVGNDFVGRDKNSNTN